MNIKIFFYGGYLKLVEDDRMDKKWLLISLIFCILIIAIGFFVLNSNNVVQVGSTSFKLPDGYVEGTPNQFGAVNLTDGKYSIFVVEHNGTDVKKYINEYNKDFVKTKNRTIDVLTLNIEGLDMYKSSNVDNPNNVHYWVVKNGKTFEFYKWAPRPCFHTPSTWCFLFSFLTPFE